jgi:F-type H+-transporting ATPase subunit a
VAFLIVLSLPGTRALKSVPDGLQNFLENVVETVETMLADTMGKHGKSFFALIASPFLFILLSNLIGLIPWFFPPTANINATLALIVVVLTHIVGIKKHGFSYVKHSLGPVWWLAFDGNVNPFGTE